MTAPTIFDTCTPRSDVLQDEIAEADFAADLASVVAGRGSPEYRDPVRFFANTYPTRGLQSLLANICRRLANAGGEVAAIFRLDTSYGGGKTHGLIALTHAARGLGTVPNISEFIDPSLLPKGRVRVAAFDGENADPANGRAMGDDVLAFTPWGEIAYALAGRDGYERVRRSDERHIAPGAETLRELFGGEPTLILLDELSVYLRKVRHMEDVRAQLTAFLTSLFKAIEGTPNAALVYTLAIGKDGRPSDAYSEENQFIADQMGEAESVSARKATLLNPTEENETVQVLRRRLFEQFNEASINAAVDGYRKLWSTHRESLSVDAARAETVEAFRASYPLHPEVLKTLTGKTATLGNFQRVRGMLRLLARTIAHLWEVRPTDATAIHVHHIDPGHEPIRQEIVTRLGQSAYVPAISHDIAGSSAENKGLAQDIDTEHHAGMPPYATYVARTAFVHTLAFNEPLKGVTPDELRYSILGPATDISFIEEARKKFMADSAYLDDRPGTPMRFLAEANLRQVIRREEHHVDAGEARAVLKNKIQEIFKRKELEPIVFPGGAFDVPDEVGDGRPSLIVISYDAVTVGSVVEVVPELIERIFSHKGSEGVAVRRLRNNLVFTVADEQGKKEMQRKVVHRLALQELKKPTRLEDLAGHQQTKVCELESKSEQELAVAIQQCYRHIFYPSRNRVGSSEIDLAHSAIEMHSASDQPGAGQRQIVRALRDLTKLQLSEDEPSSTSYIRDRTPLKRGQMTTRALRDEFRRDPALPILIGDEIFIRGIRRGVEQGKYVYQRGELLFGPGDPPASIAIDEDAVLFTMAFAKSKSVWPRKPKEDEPGPSGKGTQPPGGKKEDEVKTPPEKKRPLDETAPFAAEGALKEALVKLWEQVRAKKVGRIERLSIRMFEAGDGFRMLGPVGAVSGATKHAVMRGGYETREGGEFTFEFEGPVGDAQPVREFLELQLREGKSRDLEVKFELSFAEGLVMTEDATEKLTKRLTQFANGPAYVVATTEGKQE